MELGPFDYDRENYTRSLWIAEGVTDYYGDLFSRHASLSSDPEYLDALSDAIEKLQATPGRLVQPVELASFDAWIKQYRPDDNSNNVTVDYYTKGSVIGFLLDAEIRRATGNRRSLDDVMRTAYRPVLWRVRLHDGTVESAGVRSGRPRFVLVVPACHRVH